MAGQYHRRWAIMNRSSLWSRVVEALVLVLAIAIVADVAAGLLQPLLPGLIGLILVVVVIGWLLRRY